MNLFVFIFSKKIQIDKFFHNYPYVIHLTDFDDLYSILTGFPHV